MSTTATVPDRRRWLLDGADVSDNDADDSAVRIALAFDGTRKRFGFRDLLFFEQVRFFPASTRPGLR